MTILIYGVLPSGVLVMGWKHFLRFLLTKRDRRLSCSEYRRPTAETAACLVRGPGERPVNAAWSSPGSQ